MLNELICWQAEKSSRSVDISINPDGLKIWVYDFDLKSGQYIKSVREINLEQQTEANERFELERLKAKYAKE